MRIAALRSELHHVLVTMADRIPWLSQASRRKRWLVGVSGGGDSVALLHLLVEQGFSDLRVCHLDHGLRGRESTGDARFVQRMSAGLGLESEVGRVDVKRLMELGGESMETAARNARHAFFAQCARKFKCRRLVLAHHADDQAETILWNLLRGSHGLKGMRESQDFMTRDGLRLEIHRPLLALRRTELVEWLGVRKLRWREDSSNHEAIAIRNRLRNEAFPLLSEISGRDAVSSLLKNALDMEARTELEAWAVERAAARDPQGRLHVPVLRTLPVALQRAVIADYLKGAGTPSIDRTVVSRVIEMLDPAGPHSMNLPGGARLRRRAARLFLECPPAFG